MDETVGGADIGELDGAVAVGGEAVGVGLCSLHDDGGWRLLTDGCTKKEFRKTETAADLMFVNIDLFSFLHIS